VKVPVIAPSPGWGKTEMISPKRTFVDGTVSWIIATLDASPISTGFYELDIMPISIPTMSATG
jgi:hypothetical protein